MEYFDNAWYKCRTGLDDMLRTKMTTLAGLVGGHFFFFFFFPKKTFLVLDGFFERVALPEHVCFSDFFSCELCFIYS